MDPREFEVLAKLTRTKRQGSENTPGKAAVCSAARRVLIDGAKPSAAAKEFGLGRQSVSNAVKRLLAAEAIVLSGFAHKRDSTSEGWRNSKVQLSDTEFEKLLRVYRGLYKDDQIDKDDPRAWPIAVEVYMIGTQKSATDAADHVCKFWHEAPETATEVAAKVCDQVKRMKFKYMKG